MYPLHVGSLTVERVTIPIAGLPDALQGTRIVQLSDFHYDGYRLSDRLLEEAIAQANAAQPDLVVLTGDFITTVPYPVFTLAQKLQTLQSRRGICAVLGNHDYHYPKARKQVIHALSEVGIHVLWNQRAEPLGPEFPIVGLADYESYGFNPAIALDPLSPKTPRIVLSHNPASLVALQSWRVDLQLSGHTHGGQIVIPGLGNPQAWISQVHQCLPASMRRKASSPKKQKKRNRMARQWEWSQGLYRVEHSWLYINRGLGSYFPGRLFCPPEVTVIDLVPAAS